MIIDINYLLGGFFGGWGWGRGCQALRVTLERINSL